MFASAWPALLLATVCLLPFLNKAFNIDDPWFLYMAQQIVRHPTHPMDFQICWNNADFSHECAKASQFATGNPLLGQIGQGYLLLPTILGGAHEWIAHLTQLVLVWIAILCMASLVLRFGWDRWHAMAGALLLVAIPPFLPMASTAMPEMLATTLTLISIERLAAWKTEQKWQYGIAAGLALGLVAFARPHLLLVIPLAAFFLLQSINPRKLVTQIRSQPSLWAPVFAALVLVFAIIKTLSEHVGAVAVPFASISQMYITGNLYSYLAYFAFPLPLALCWLVKQLYDRRYFLVCSVFALALPWLLLSGHSLIPSLVIIGFAALANLIYDYAKSKDHQKLFLLLWILIPLPIVRYVQLPMKYLLPCVPAVILACFRWLDGLPVRFTKAAIVGFVACSTAYSMLILRSDAEFGAFGRDALHQLIAPHVAAGEKVWFPGQYWSYWYAPLDGASLAYPGGPQPQPGDLLVVDLFSGADHPPLDHFPHRTFVAAVSHEYRFGRTMGGGMGLYSNRVGFWLWGFGESKLDRFELWRID